MDKVSVTRTAPPSTHSILAGAHLCDQISALLLVEPQLTRQVFLGEPVQEVLAMVEWAFKYEGETGFDPERILPAWAEKRGRGYWRVEDRRVEECRCCHGTGWVLSPFKSANERQEEREGVECPQPTPGQGLPLPLFTEPSRACLLESPYTALRIVMR